MEKQEKIYSVKKQRTVPIFVQIICILVVLALIPLGYYTYYKQTSQLSQLTLPTGAVVVTQVQRMGKLETVTYTLQQVIDYNSDPSWKGFFDNKQELFVIYGTATAGVDLSALKKGDVNIAKKGDQVTSITLHMPATMILSTSIDNSRSKVYGASGGVFSPFESLSPNTQNQILAQAQTSLQSDACKDGILQQAANSAQTQLTSFLSTLGFPAVKVIISAGTCS